MARLHRGGTAPITDTCKMMNAKIGNTTLASLWSTARMDRPLMSLFPEA